MRPWSSRTSRTDPKDRAGPTRPVSSGRVNLPIAWIQWLETFAAGFALAWFLISPVFAGVLASLWAFGIIYNVPPIRTKDVPYLDVTTEAINNPIHSNVRFNAARRSPSS